MAQGRSFLQGPPLLSTAFCPRPNFSFWSAHNQSLRHLDNSHEYRATRGAVAVTSALIAGRGSPRRGRAQPVSGKKHDQNKMCFFFLVGNIPTQPTIWHFSKVESTKTTDAQEPSNETPKGCFPALKARMTRHACIIVTCDPGSLSSSQRYPDPIVQELISLSATNLERNARGKY